MSAKKKLTLGKRFLQSSSSEKNDDSNTEHKNKYKIVVISLKRFKQKFEEILKKLNTVKEDVIFNVSNTLKNLTLPKIQICAISSKQKYFKPYLKYLYLVGATACITLGIIKINPRPAVVVYLNNKPITIANSRSEFYDILQTLQQSWKANYNKDINLAGEPYFKMKLLPKKLLCNTTQIATAIESNTNILKKGFGISVDGNLKVVLSDEQSTKQVLDSIKGKYQADGQSVEFIENVQVVDAFVPLEYIQSTDSALVSLTQSIDGVKDYIVKKGDTLWDIADNSNISVEKLFELNPNIGEKLKIGQSIKLSAPKAVLNVKTTQYAEIQEKTPYETKFESDSNKYKGERKVLVAGQNGEKILKVAIVKQNGVEISKSILEEKVIKDSKPEVVAIGTKEYKKNETRGIFGVPAFGSVTSRFGFRWGRMHEGIDISGSLGSPIYAADAGKVIFSGVESGYGNIIKISHESGYVTYYGHNSKNLVKVGQSVEKGEKIALVGNTGRSTGCHVHFEVRKNNTPQDPLKFLK